MAKTRNKEGFRSVESADGRFTPKLNVVTSRRIKKYCERKNLNCTKFVCEAINFYLNYIIRHEKEMLLKNFSKEELIAIIIRDDIDIPEDKEVEDGRGL